MSGTLTDQTQAQDTIALQSAITAYLAEIRHRLDAAATIARTAEVWARAGDIEEALRTALKFEPITYEADRLLAAVCVLTTRLKELRHAQDKD